MISSLLKVLKQTEMYLEFFFYQKEREISKTFIAVFIL